MLYIKYLQELLRLGHDFFFDVPSQALRREIPAVEINQEEPSFFGKLG
tara:strand:+ start:3519 stop:3662 length:144 start_codon:yes stop_codon:yes gene_type:complete